MHIFSGIHKGRKIQSPIGDQTRPTSGRLRESLFNICQSVETPYTFLDAFAGSGAMGLEALSRGASHVTFIDNNRESIRCIRENVSALKAERMVEIIYGDVFDVLKRMALNHRQFDIIYADPPYAMKFGEPTIKLVDNHKLIKPFGLFFLEDELNKLSVDLKLEHLSLIDIRKMGRSFLWQFAKSGKL